MTKRLISLLLALLCVASLLMIPAAAVEPEEGPNDAGEVVETTAPADTTAPDAEEPETSPEATAEPVESAVPAESPEPSESAAPVESAEPTATPDVTPTPAPTETPNPTPTPKPTPTPAPTPWYQNAMDYAVENNLLQGDDKGNLMPNEKATRAQVATILTRVFGLTEGKTITQFTDVSKSAWYYNALSVAAEMGILKGDTEFTMRPNANITREEAFVIIARTFSIPNGNVSALASFTDVEQVDSWAAPALAGMVERGLLQGNKGLLTPRANITRAEFAQVLYNLGIVFFKDPADLPEDGFAVYTGSKTLDVTDFKGTLYLAGSGKAVTLEGDARDASVYIRKNPGAEVTISGEVGDVHICTRGAMLQGSGSALSVEVAALYAENKLNCGMESVNFDAGLAGVSGVTNEPAALTPDHRTTNVTITYSGMDPTGASGGRKCTVHWWVDGKRMSDTSVVLNGNGGTLNLPVGETLWRRQMPSERSVKVQLLYGTDSVSNAVIIPVKNYTDAEFNAIARNNTYPYKIEVCRSQCTVMVYGMNKSGEYNILHKVFVCSPGYATPLGTFHTGTKWRWEVLMGGVWGQYCTQVYQGILFHSVFYHSTDPSTLYYNAYNQLGTICSHGCIRVTVADAKWLYENCPSGTAVHIYDSNSLPVAKPTAQKIPTDSPWRGWDPTDPDSRNPWKK